MPFVLLLLDGTGLPEASLMLTVVSVTVALSVFAHGVTAWPGANRYADWYRSHSHDHSWMPESIPVTVPRYRRESHGAEPSDHKRGFGSPLSPGLPSTLRASRV